MEEILPDRELNNQFIVENPGTRGSQTITVLSENNVGKTYRYSGRIQLQ